MTSRETVSPDRYLVQWVLTLALLSALVVHVQHAARLASTPKYIPPPITQNTSQVNWFMIVRMPAITAQYESGIATMKVRYGQWLTALSNAGFKPMLLSEVHWRLQHHLGFPEKTLVIIFDPGYRRTYEIVAPIFEQHQWPAVWLSNGPAMSRGHREYITYHTAEKMRQSGWWDVGYRQKDGTYVLDTLRDGKIQFGDSANAPWTAGPGGTCINHVQSLKELRRLNILADWTPPDLVNRLRVELPVEHPVTLTTGLIQNSIWGLTVEGKEPSAAFDLKIPDFRRDKTLNWFGTEGVNDFELHAESKLMVGDLWLRLRWNDADSTGINVFISNKECFVEQDYHGFTRRLLDVARHRRAFNSGFKVDITLVGKSLQLRLDGRAPMNAESLSLPSTAEGLVQTHFTDRLKGSARADKVWLVFHPIRGSAEPPQSGHNAF